MKEVISAFNSDVLRPIVSMFIPGAIAAAPALLALLWANPWLRDLLSAARTEATVGVILVLMFLGLLCETLGSWLEYWLDGRLDKVSQTGDSPERAHTKNWYKYLRIAYRIEPVGHHYMRTLVMHLKFELGSCTAFLLALVGIWFLPTGYLTRIWCSVLPVVLSAFFLYESSETHQVLSTLREEMLKGITEWPTTDPGARTATPGT